MNTTIHSNMYIHMLLHASHTEGPFNHFTSIQCVNSLFNSVVRMLIFTVDGSPSESDLLNVLDIVPEWYYLAIALGVPFEQVKHLQQIQTGGIEALCYWRYGESGQNYPTTWRFLLDKIEERRGLNVAQRVKETFFAKPSLTDPKKTQSNSNSETSTLTTSPSDVYDQLLGEYMPGYTQYLDKHECIREHIMHANVERLL